MPLRMSAVSICASLLVASPAFAGEQPLYQPAPDWVEVRPLPAAFTTPGAVKPSYDLQQRFEGGQVWGYFDIAQRIASPEQLAANTVLTLPWFPDKGDLIIHELSIIRGTSTIDVLARGQKFTVLRREQALEQQQLTGMLSATLAVEGLQVGDTVRLRASVTNRDPALQGHVQWGRPLLAEPAQTSGATLRLMWPKGDPVRWKILADGVATTAGTDGRWSVLKVSQPAPRQTEMPDDAPGRYRHPPLIEASTFSDWRDVSKAMAPLYVTTGAIAQGGPLAAEVARIEREETDPLHRAARALRLVQDQVRYLAISMDGGNYVPQAVEKTWAVRYGDCKAKTLLLLAMLQALGIEAEPVLANIGADDLVTRRLPAPAAFNHVFVRARIGGEAIWMDGTGRGTRLADLHDSPLLRNILPLRSAGADLETLTLLAPARPSVDLNLAIDESTSVDLPGVVDATLVLRGPKADALSLFNSQAAAKERREFFIAALTPFLGTGQFGALTVTSDPEQATTTLHGRGVFTTAWSDEDYRRKRKMARTPAMIRFDPDRARPSWSDIPFAGPTPDRMHVHVTIRLPRRDEGMAVEGERNLQADVAGYTATRTTTIAGGLATIDEVLTTSSREVAPAQIPAERDHLAQLVSQAPRLVAPADTLRRWELGTGNAADGTQLAAVKAVFAEAIALAEPDDTSALEDRAALLEGIGDWRGALADRNRVIALAPSAAALTARGMVELHLGDVAAAAKDAEAARKLDPSDTSALELAANIAARRGDLAGATAMLDQRIALGGEGRNALKVARASLLGSYGDPAKAVADFDGLIAASPGKPELLNGRCWTKALRQVQLDSALKDCTSAIELTDNTAPFLDSRALVWLRLGKVENALQDLDAALLQSPDQAPSRYLRAIVLKRMGRTDEAARDLAISRRMAPDLEADYARFSLTY